jgi:hypothetical protein
MEIAATVQLPRFMRAQNQAALSDLGEVGGTEVISFRKSAREAAAFESGPLNLLSSQCHGGHVTVQKAEVVHAPVRADGSLSRK